MGRREEGILLDVGRREAGNVLDVGKREEGNVLDMGKREAGRELDMGGSWDRAKERIERAKEERSLSRRASESWLRPSKTLLPGGPRMSERLLWSRKALVTWV